MTSSIRKEPYKKRNGSAPSVICRLPLGETHGLPTSKNRRPLVNCPRCHQLLAKSRLERHLFRVHPDQPPQARTGRRRIIRNEAPKPDRKPDIPIPRRDIPNRGGRTLAQIEKLLTHDPWLKPRWIGTLKRLHLKLLRGMDLDRRDLRQLGHIQESFDKRSSPRLVQGGAPGLGRRH